MKTKLYAHLAGLLIAVANCKRSGNVTWAEKHAENLARVVREHMPSGSGFDKGTQLDITQSTGEKLVFFTSFHHMTGHGFYNGWTSHKIVVRPSLYYGFTLSISGRNENDIKDLIHQAFEQSLNLAIDETGKAVAA